MSAIYPAYFARFYDVIYDKIWADRDHQYFLSQILETKGRVLDVGAGTGRLFARALAGGADIRAIDISPSMAEILLQKLPAGEHHRFSIGDIRNFHFDQPFDLVIAPGRVMMHLSDKKDQLAALENVYRNLSPGGTFIFDCFVPDLKQLISGLNRVTDFDEEYAPGRRVKRIVSTHPDLLNQEIHVDFTIEWDDEEGFHSETWNTHLRYFFRYELEHLIERSPFNSYMIFGDYEEGDLKPDTREFVIKCFK